MTNINYDVSKLNEFIDNFRETLKSAEAQMAVIDEEYRKKAEKKKKELQEQADACRREIEFWENSVLVRYNGEQGDSVLADVSAKPDKKEEVKPEVDDEVVVDEDVKDVFVPNVVEEVNIEEEMKKSESSEEPVVEAWAEPAENVTEEPKIEEPKNDDPFGDFPDFNSFEDAWGK